MKELKAVAHPQPDLSKSIYILLLCYMWTSCGVQSDSSWPNAGANDLDATEARLMTPRGP
jgi:hypothetical protein